MEKNNQDITLWMTVRGSEEDEELNLFENYDDIYGIYDRVEQVTVSRKAYERALREERFAKRWGYSIRFYLN